jgi:hypothetical protein
MDVGFGLPEGLKTFTRFVTTHLHVVDHHSDLGVDLLSATSRPLEDYRHKPCNFASGQSRRPKAGISARRRSSERSLRGSGDIHRS